MIEVIKYDLNTEKKVLNLPKNNNTIKPSNPRPKAWGFLCRGVNAAKGFSNLESFLF